VLRLTPAGQPAVTPAPAGYGPEQLRTAYGLPAGGGSGRVVAIVDAFDDPRAESDLATYRSTFGLPPCGSADGCLAIVGEDGTPNRPDPDAGWAEETSLDLDAVSAGCPDCRILLVEARSTSLPDLSAAVRTAASWPDVVAVSNSYGGGELSIDRDYADAWSHAGVWIVASSGDNGYGVEFPASIPTVVAAGGTTLVVGADGTRTSERAWGGSGSGCSALFAKPAWQHDGCARRAVADVSADADPDTGLAVHDTYDVPGSGWIVVGGTSASSPFIAAVHALSGGRGETAAGLYAARAALRDVTTGSNGTCRTPRSLCHAGRGWDGPTGLGAPAGTAAFSG
jgi:subtilase family serine protease